MPRTLVPDTSVLVSGRLSHLVEQGELERVEIVIHEAVLAWLEQQAIQGRETGVTGIDEVARLQELAGPGELAIRFEGERPLPADLENETDLEVRGLARELAADLDGELVTSDRVQSHVSRARGLSVWYLHPWSGTEEPAPEELDLFSYFDGQTMSVHLKADCVPMGKRGIPGEMEYKPISHTPLKHAEISNMAREIIEATRRDPESFIEIERPGATVCQLGPVRIAIARPPFSDGLEITAVRPVARLSIEEYGLPEDVMDRITGGARGIFISGPPGSGKSTFAQAVADHLMTLERVIKTMESPRDLQLDPLITQYAPLEGSMELTSDVLLLVRPDHVIYDEVRKTDDFAIFADMRLAGVGLLGVTHANRAIDAVQRLLGRVELGMVPQVVDTVVHIKSGKIEQILELDLTVKVPEGMMEADLARPVVTVKDFSTKQPVFELYTYGEQIVVMPIKGGGEKARRDQLAESQLVHLLGRHLEGDFEVRMAGANTAEILVEPWEIAQVIGSGGSNVKRLERELGVKLDIRSFADADGGDRPARRDAAKRGAEMRPTVRKTKKHLVLVLDEQAAGKTCEVVVDGESVFEATVGRQGEVRVRRQSPEGRAVLQAYEHGGDLSVRI